MDIIVTSGIATGHAADVDKIKTFRKVVEKQFSQLHLELRQTMWENMFMM